MNRDSFKKLSEIIKIDEISQKLQSYKSDFYFHFKINKKVETYKTAE